VAALRQLVEVLAEGLFAVLVEQPDARPCHPEHPAGGLCDLPRQGADLAFGHARGDRHAAQSALLGPVASQGVLQPQLVLLALGDVSCRDDNPHRAPDGGRAHVCLAPKQAACRVATPPLVGQLLPRDGSGHVPRGFVGAVGGLVQANVGHGQAGKLIQLVAEQLGSGLVGVQYRAGVRVVDEDGLAHRVVDRGQTLLTGLQLAGALCHLLLEVGLATAQERGKDRDDGGQQQAQHAGDQVGPGGARGGETRAVTDRHDPGAPQSEQRVCLDGWRALGGAPETGRLGEARHGPGRQPHGLRAVGVGDVHEVDGQQMLLVVRGEGRGE